MDNAKTSSLHHENRPVNKFQVCWNITKLHSSVINRRAKYILFIVAVWISHFIRKLRPQVITRTRQSEFSHMFIHS
jgi:hypothetical protein